MRILVMGVSGCGKSRFGNALAQKLNVAFYDGDDFHSPEAVEKMASGQALSDEDRLPWLERLSRLQASNGAAVLACSALKRSYRNLLRQATPDLQICYLRGQYDSILLRMEARQVKEGHFFRGASMLQSQFAALEEPGVDEKAIIVPVELSPAEQLALVVKALGNGRYLEK